MKNKKGMTLIEMMIAIAVLGVIFVNFAPHELAYFYQNSHCKLIESEIVFELRNRINRNLREASELKSAFDRKVVFDNFQIVVSSDNHSMRVGNRLYVFENFKLGNFEKVGENAVTCQLVNGGQTVTLFWRAGNDKK